jgi:hypothetical protein
VGSSPGSGGSSGATPAPSAPTSGGTPVAPPAEWFHYTANFNFGKPGSPKKFKSAGSFTLLPDDTTAAIMFVGVTDDGKSALFFIADPGFQASGEGKCNVAGADCRYVALKLSDTKNEETFTAADGSVTYKLKLTSIQNEKVAAPKVAASPTASPKQDPGMAASNAGASLATQTSEGLLPDILIGGPSVRRVR